MAGVQYLQNRELQDGLTSLPSYLLERQYATTPGDDIDPEYAVNNYLRGNLSRNDLGNGPALFEHETPGSGQATRSEHWLNLHYGGALEASPYTGGGFVGDITPEKPQHSVYQRMRAYNEAKLKNKVRDFGQDAEQQTQDKPMSGSDMRQLYQDLHKSRARLMSKNFSSTLKSNVGHADSGPLRNRSARVTTLLNEHDYHDPKTASNEQKTGILSGGTTGHKSGVLDQELTHTKDRSRKNQIRGGGVDKKTSQGQATGDQHLWSSVEGEVRPGKNQTKKGSVLSNIVGKFKEKSNKLQIRSPEKTHKYVPARTKLDQDVSTSNENWFRGVSKWLTGKAPTPKTEQKFGRGKQHFVGGANRQSVVGLASAEQEQDFGDQESSAVGRTTALRRKMHGPTPVATDMRVNFDLGANILSNNVTRTGAQASFDALESLEFEGVSAGHRSGLMSAKNNMHVGHMDHLLEEQKSAVGIAVNHAGIISRPMAATVEFSEEIESF